MIPEEAALARRLEEAHEDWCMENEARDPWHVDSWKHVASAVIGELREARAQALEDAADELDGEFTELRRAQGKSFTWLCGIADAEEHIRARAVTERGTE